MDHNIEINSKPFEYTLSLFSGKWKITILYWISHYPSIRYGELKSSITGITHKMLSQQLKDLETDELIIKITYDELPPHVEYKLSPKGETLMPILHEMCKWGHQNMQG